MSDKTIILDTPAQIHAFALLQVYFKLKLEVGHPNGPKWKNSPRMQAIAILEHAGITFIGRKTKRQVLAVYKEYLEAIGVLNNDQDT